MTESKTKLLEYHIVKDYKIASGAYGSLYPCSEISSGKKDLVAKVGEKDNCNLKIEANILKYLQGGIGIPKVINYFIFDGNEYLIMERLGQNLRNFYKDKKNILIKDLMDKSIQMLNRIEFLHSRGLIHCDIKPENFVVGEGDNKGIVYLIDFGISRKYMDIKTKQHIKFNENSMIIGTLSFCSVNSMLKYSLSRRDDLESLAYTIIFLWKGFLPWDIINAKSSKEQIELVRIIKDSSHINEICSGTHKNMVSFLNYSKSLEFEETPNYRYLRKLLKEIAKES